MKKLLINTVFLFLISSSCFSQTNDNSKIQKQYTITAPLDFWIQTIKSLSKSTEQTNIVLPIIDYLNQLIIEQLKVEKVSDSSKNLKMENN